MNAAAALALSHFTGLPEPDAGVLSCAPDAASRAVRGGSTLHARALHAVGSFVRTVCVVHAGWLTTGDNDREQKAKNRTFEHRAGT